MSNLLNSYYFQWIIYRQVPMDKKLIPLLLLIASIPFGVALHNLAILAFMFWLLSMKPNLPTKLDLSRWLSILAPLLLCIWIMVSTVLNPQNPEEKPWQYLGGYLPLSLLPLLAELKLGQIQPLNKPILKYLAAIAAAWGIVVLSQAVLGWSLRNPAGGVDYRAFGFYSHPLTLAYAALLLWPWALAAVFTKPSNRHSWLIVTAIASILLFSQSRACWALALLILLWNLAKRLKGRTRLIAGLIVCLSVIGIAGTENKISQRFGALFSANNPDRQSSYPDDRVAFWHAHLEMIKERPIIGHGMHLGTSYRKPYYEKIGLAELEKKYEAHNQYLQTWTNGGIIGLSIYLVWLAALVFRGRYLSPSLQGPWLQMLAVFAAGALVQNAYSDSEVRHVFTVALVTLAYLDPKRRLLPGGE